MRSSLKGRARWVPRGKRLMLWLLAGLGACGGQEEPSVSGRGSEQGHARVRVTNRESARAAGSADRSVTSAPRELTRLHAGDDAHVPIVMFSGLGGTAEVFRPLAESLPEWQPFYAAPAHAGVAGDALSVRGVASAYEAAVGRLRERGPIALGGYSFGMLIAYELALRLREAEMPVSQLIALDAFAPGYPRKLDGWAWARAHLEELTGSAERRDVYVEQHMGALAHWLPLVGRASADDGDSDAKERGADPMGELWRALERASHTYVPASTESAPMLLFVASEPFHWVATDTDDPFRGWRSHLEGHIETRSLQGSHLDVFEPPNDAALTRGIREVLYDETVE